MVMATRPIIFRVHRIRDRGMVVLLSCDLGLRFVLFREIFWGQITPETALVAMNIVESLCKIIVYPTKSVEMRKAKQMSLRITK